MLLLPKEKEKIEHLAETKKVDIKVLPRIGVGLGDNGTSPESILVYQLMGRERDGNICPFLDTDGSEQSPHGGARCTIYDERPTACKAYPLVSIDPTASKLDSNCRYCVSSNENKVCNLGLNNEIMALNEIMVSTRVGEGTQLWRYATNVGDPSDDKKLLPGGWIKVQSA